MSIWEQFRLNIGESTREELALRDTALPDLDWTIFPPDAVRSTFDAPSGSLSVISIGQPEAPRVVLVPGVTGSKEDFVLLAPLLANAGYFVQSYDLAGQYESALAGPTGTEQYSYDLFVIDLIAFLESGSTPAHVLGYSFGGIIAQIALAQRPDLFGTLALMSVPPRSGQSFSGVRWIGPISYVISARGIASLMVWGIVTNKNKVPPGRLDLVRMRFSYTSRRSIDDITLLMKHVPDSSVDVRSSKVPLLIAVGHHDLWPIDQHREFATRINAEFRVYPTGHSPCETTPHLLAYDLIELFHRTPITP
ncbi:alpha/beta fold hydrolase [Leifsonia sp. A12D58]|uniref:alpha/beta fold hydrolase n=1 Tax=Leifsonia sp. A12D58 TaxID=3397674 RepID=UPI0039E1BBB6